MKKPISAKAWTKMNQKELAAATREFDDPGYAPPVAKMPAELRTRHGKALVALRTRGRRASKTNSARVQISLEPQLLRKTDALAHQSGLTRSEVISRGLQLLLAS